MQHKTEKELLESYQSFIAFVKKVFKGERLEKLLFMYSESELGRELAVAPASGKSHFHSAYVGGYIDHVMNVSKNAFKLKKLFEEGGGDVNFTDEELFFSALHHDLGKLGNGTAPYYLPQMDEWAMKKKNEFFTHNTELQYFDVTHRAIWLLNQYGIKYTEKEMLGIMLADGLYNKANEKYFISYSEDFQLKSELPYIIHWADHMACRQEFSQWKLKNK
jgi:hypothetical protein